MLFHTYTAVHSDGLGIFLKNNANAELISTFTYYCVVGFSCIGGSKIRSLNSSNAYGEYGVYSAGFDAGETANTGTIKGTMLTYTNVLTTSFTNGEQITGGTSGATAYVINVQSEPKTMYIVQKSGTFQASETVTGGSSGATANLAAGGSFETNQTGRILVTTFTTAPDAGDSLQFASTDGNAFQIQSISSVTANSVAYKVLVFSTSRATPVASNVQVIVRKEFSLVRLTGHDFLQVGTGGTDTTNWPNNPSQDPSQADQVVTNQTDPGRVYYTATDDLGNFYVGDQFKVDQATGNVTLDASAFNLSGLESLRLGSVGGLIGAAVGEFSTDVTMSQNSDTKVSTQKAVKTYVDTLDGVTPVGGTFSIAGISTVTGTTHFTKQLNVAGVSTFHGNVNLLDGDRLRIGSSEDLQIYHDSNHSYIAENGAGDLKIQASAGSIIIQKSDGEEMIKANVDGAVELYQDDVLRLTTTTTGVSIGGSLTVPGNLSIGGTITYEDVTNIDSVGIVTARSGIFVPDSQTIHLGNASGSGDLRLYHNGSHSYIQDAGTGRLKLLTSYFNVSNAADDEHIIEGIQDGAVNLYHNGSKKFETSSSGVTISGTASATTFSGSGASLTNLNGSNIASGTVPVARIGTGTKDTTTFYRGDGTFQVVSTDLVGDSSPQLGGPLDTNGNNISFADNIQAVFGTGNDSAVRFNGTDLVITTAGKIKSYAGSTGFEFYSNDNSEVLAKFIKDGSCELYYNNVERVTTKDNGAQITGSLEIEGGTVNGNHDATLYVTANNNNDWGLIVDYGTGSSGKSEYGAKIVSRTGSSHAFSIAQVSGGSHAEAFLIDGDGNVDKSGHIYPRGNNSFDLGSTSYRWRNIYTGDLNLSNEGSKNDVDGTWGDYTIQEGESDLFLINKRNGKKYKFNLTEVS
jgi:hypothetical protein